MVGSEPPRSLVEEAQSRGVPVVKKEWLFDGIEDGEMPDPNASKYSFVAESASAPLSQAMSPEF